MFFDFGRKNQISFQDPATPIAEGIIDLHNSIFFWLIFIFIPVVVILIRILNRSYKIWLNPDIKSIEERKKSMIFSKIIHGTVLEIIWTIMPTIILVLIAIPSFGLIYAMDTIIDPDFTIKIIGNQWYWTYDFNYSSFVLGDIEDIFNRFSISMEDATKEATKAAQENFIPQLALDLKLKIKQVLHDIKIKNINDQMALISGPEHNKELLETAYREAQAAIAIQFPKTPYLIQRLQFILEMLTPGTENHATFIRLIEVFENYSQALQVDSVNYIYLNRSKNFDIAVHSIFIEPLVNNITIDLWHVIPNMLSAEELNAIKERVVENTFKLWSHNVKDYLFDSYIKPEADLSKSQDLRLLSVDAPLSLPLYTNIRALVTSTDVLHSFAVPSFGIKLDAIPGRLNSVSIFIERPGHFFGQCSEICGVQHGYMPIEIYASLWLPFIFKFLKKNNTKKPNSIKNDNKRDFTSSKNDNKNSTPNLLNPHARMIFVVFYFFFLILSIYFFITVEDYATIKFFKNFVYINYLLAVIFFGIFASGMIELYKACKNIKAITLVLSLAIILSCLLIITIIYFFFPAILLFSSSLLVTYIVILNSISYFEIKINDSSNVKKYKHLLEKYKIFEVCNKLVLHYFFFVSDFKLVFFVFWTHTLPLILMLNGHYLGYFFAIDSIIWDFSTQVAIMLVIFCCLFSILYILIISISIEVSIFTEKNCPELLPLEYSQQNNPNLYFDKFLPGPPMFTPSVTNQLAKRVGFIFFGMVGGYSYELFRLLDIQRQLKEQNSRLKTVDESRSKAEKNLSEIPQNQHENKNDSVLDSFSIHDFSDYIVYSIIFIFILLFIIKWVLSYTGLFNKNYENFNPIVAIHENLNGLYKVFVTSKFENGFIDFVKKNKFKIILILVIVIGSVCYSIFSASSFVGLSSIGFFKGRKCNYSNGQKRPYNTNIVSKRYLTISEVSWKEQLKEKMKKELEKELVPQVQEDWNKDLDKDWYIMWKQVWKEDWIKDWVEDFAEDWIIKGVKDWEEPRKKDWENRWKNEWKLLWVQDWRYKQQKPLSTKIFQEHWNILEDHMPITLDSDEVTWLKSYGHYITIAYMFYIQNIDLFISTSDLDEIVQRVGRQTGVSQQYLLYNNKVELKHLDGKISHNQNIIFLDLDAYHEALKKAFGDYNRYNFILKKKNDTTKEERKKLYTLFVLLMDILRVYIMSLLISEETFLSDSTISNKEKRESLNTIKYHLIALIPLVRTISDLGKSLYCLADREYDTEMGNFLQFLGEFTTDDMTYIVEHNSCCISMIICLLDDLDKKDYRYNNGNIEKSHIFFTGLVFFMDKNDSVFDSFILHEIGAGIFNSITVTLILIIIGGFALFYTRLFRRKNGFFKTIGAIHTGLDELYNMFLSSTIELCGRKGSRIFGLMLTIFIYLATLNLLGLLLFAVTVKSQLSTTFWFSLTIFLSCIFIGVKNKGLDYFLMFWNTSVGIAMRILLLMVELLSFFIRPLSYALRLFANLLSGHILLHLFAKVVLVLKKKNKYALAVGPLGLLFAFGVLETLVAVLQGFIPPTLLQIWLYECF